MQSVSTHPFINTRHQPPHVINTDPPSFCSLNWAAQIKVGAMFVLSATYFTAAGLVMASTIALGTPVAISFFLAGITLFFQARQALHQEKTAHQIEENEYVTRINAEEIVAIQIKLTEITTDLEELVSQREDIDDQQIKLRLKVAETQDKLRTQLHYLGQLARTNAK